MQPRLFITPALRGIKVTMMLIAVVPPPCAISNATKDTYTYIIGLLILRHAKLWCWNIPPPDKQTKVTIY